MVIPKLHYKSQGATPQEHLDNIQQACLSGVELVQLNVAAISDKKLLKIAEKAHKITSLYQTRLIITNNAKIAKEIKADGVYFDEIQNDLSAIRKNLYTWQVIGCTANNLEESKSLINAEVDYIGLGPFKSATDNTITLNGYTVLIEELKTETPIIAFGEITLEDVPQIIETGVNGIVASEEITKDFNKILTFNKLLNASSTQEQRYNFD